MAKRGRPKGAKESEASKKRKAERKARKEAELRAKQAGAGARSAAAFMRHFGVPGATIQTAGPRSLAAAPIESPTV